MAASVQLEKECCQLRDTDSIQRNNNAYKGTSNSSPSSTECGLCWKGLLMRVFHSRSPKETIKLSVSASGSQDVEPVWDALGLGQSPLVDAPYLTWVLSHADGDPVSGDIATVNKWQG